MKKAQCAMISLVLFAALTSVAAAQQKPKVTADVVYGHKDGMALVMHVLQPPQPNGAGVIQVVSGGYFSEWAPADAYVRGMQPYLSAGYTVFAVFHGSNPRYSLVDAVADMRSAVRFIRSHAADYAVDPQRLGAVGASAGGHLALMLATTGEDGDTAAPDPFRRAGSRIAAAVAISAPADFREPDSLIAAALRRGGVDQAGASRLKPALTFDSSLGRAMSPVLNVSPDDAPTLLIHGAVDLLVPIENSQQMHAELQAKRVPSELVALADVGHGTAATPAARQELGKLTSRAVAWFDQHLAAKPKP